MRLAAPLTALSAALLCACGGNPGRDTSTGAAETAEATAPPPSAPAAAAPAIEVREIALDGDRTFFPLALVEGADGVLLFARERDRIVRYAVDPDAGTATRAAVIPIATLPSVVAYDSAGDRLFWASAHEQHRERQPRGESDFPRPDLVVTAATSIGHDGGLDAIVRVCPSPTGGSITARPAAPPLCDHEIRALLPLDAGLLLAGHLTERVGAASGEAWLGLASAEGALVAQHRLPAAIGNARIVVLARGTSDVLAVSWSGRGPTRATFALLRPPALEPVATASRTTPSPVAEPWTAAVPAPDGGFWVALDATGDSAAIVTIAADGSIAADHEVEGVRLGPGARPSLGLRGGAPWLAIAKANGPRSGALTVAAIDPRDGAASARHEIALPAGFAPERVLARDGGYLVAGRVGLERPLLVWIPLPADRS